MQRECVKEAPTVEEALDSALEDLGVQQDAVEYEVLEEPGRKFFGLSGDKVAKVRVWVKEAYLAEIEEARKGAKDVLGVEEEPAEEDLPMALQVGEPEAELSDEDLDRVADTAVETLKRVLEAFGITGSSIEEYEGDEGEIILDVVGGDLAILIGRHGKTLDALQALVAAVTTRTLGFRYPVVVDVEGYRHRRRQKVEDIARRAADRASRQKTAVRLRPMTAYERRIVHVVLRDDRRIRTESEGEDPYRCVVVKPK
jgi:spoIIIJ-associated protein